MGGRCGIPLVNGVGAVSLNITVVNPQGPGFILIYPEGGSQPLVSTLNYVSGQVVANAAIVPVGGSFGVTVVAGVSGTDLIIDTNGYFSASDNVVNEINGLSGHINLAAGTNITITPSGQTFTVAATGGPGGFLPSGTSGQTLRHSGSAWVANNALTSDGTNVALTGALNWPVSGIREFSGGVRWFHNFGFGNTFLGPRAGNFTMNGFSNIGIGEQALAANGNGSSNTGVGFGVLGSNISGGGNVAIGTGALANNISGGGNIGIGFDGGLNLTTGDGNICIGNPGTAGESATIRIGSAQTTTFIAGIHGTGGVNPNPVYIDSAGQLGTNPFSSVRYKQDIQDMGHSSSGLLKLRPVTFRYKPRSGESNPSPVRYGLIAEEVEQVMPGLVVYAPTGEAEGVLYHELPTMLLNELQKQERRIEEQKDLIQALEARLAVLEEGPRQP